MVRELHLPLVDPDLSEDEKKELKEEKKKDRVVIIDISPIDNDTIDL